MKLQNKVILILASAWIIISVIMYIDSRYVVAKNYQQLESNLIHSNIHDVTSAYNRMLSTLALYTLAWAQWDDAYRFMQKKNQRFPSMNFVPGTFLESKINFFLLYDTHGKFYYGKYFNLEKNKFEPIPQSLLTYLSQNKAFVTHNSTTSRKMGALHIPEGTVMMSSLPIMTSNAKGPVRGALLMGYYLSKTHIQSLSNLVDIELTFYSLPLTSTNSLVNTAYMHLQKGEKQFVMPINSKYTEAFILLNDIDNQPTGMLQMKLPRIIYTESRSTINHYLMMVSLIGITILILMWYLLKIFVLNHVLSVSNQVIEINRNNQFNTPIKLSSKDELGKMVSSINHMMQLISLSQKELHYIANHDGLTLLPNRNYFYSLLQKALRTAEENHNLIAVMFLDMDKFKEVNDTYGHDIGDHLLRIIAQRLRSATRKTDVVGRLAGDEFILFSQDITEINSIDSITKRILDVMAKPISIEKIMLNITFSVGISIFPNDGKTAEELLRFADHAMYIAKKQPGNSFHFYGAKTSFYHA